MRWSVVPFEVHHLSLIVPQPAQRLGVADMARAMQGPFGDAWTATVDGVPVAAAGVVELWPGRGHAWALLDEEASRHMLRITRAIAFALDAVPFRRVEMHVDAEFAAASRWAEMLGFVRETPQPMRAYTPDGRDCYLYARVK